MDRDTSVDRFLPLRPVEFDILLSLASGDRHGYGIIQDAEQRGVSDPPDVGTLYRGLRRLEDQGLVRPSGKRAAADATDQRRHYYGITPLGRRVARAEARRMEALMRVARSSGLLGANAS